MPVLEDRSKQQAHGGSAAGDVLFGEWEFSKSRCRWPASVSRVTVGNDPIFWPVEECPCTSPITVFVVDAHGSCVQRSTAGEARRVVSSDLGGALVGGEPVILGAILAPSEQEGCSWQMKVGPSTRFALGPAWPARALCTNQPESSRALAHGYSSIAITLQETLRGCLKTEGDLSAHLTFEDAEGVRAFLAANPRLSASLWELIEVIQELISTSEAPILRVANDPLAEALAKIDEVDEAWWMRLPPEVGRLVTVDVDYR
jgi:hypothetical protein